MRSFNLKKLAAVAAFSLVGVFGTGEIASAQGNSGKNDQKKADKQQEEAIKQSAKAEQKRVQMVQQRQADWTVQNTRILADQQRQVVLYNRSAPSSGVSFVFGDANTDRNARYRVYRNGSYYNTDYRGAELLQQAVNEGYRQGFAAGRNARNSQRYSIWSNSNVYQRGTYGYQSYVSQSQYQYYFRQGFQRGYQDGSNSQYQDDYYGDYQYGSNNNGVLNILGTILGQILNIRSY